ncbi:MAG: three-Cys-motif partner protein TcmP [Cyanobacteria bacterium SBLK]|nr:three-Cys-motif partner protein TcmP [Cyanobacteria bacterium SBLK]
MSKKDEITWLADGSYLPDIEPHTKAKHLILEEYIANYIRILHGTGRRGVTKFTFVDGFCGGGMYEDRDNREKWKGSPIRLIEAARKGFKKAGRQYDEPLDIKYIFIDDKQSHIECLKNYSFPQVGLGYLVDEEQHEYREEFGQCIEQCQFILGEFEQVINRCIISVESRKGSSFFLLDPFGWSHVSMNSIRKINDLSGSEILYTYMIDYLKRFAFVKYEKNKRKTFNKILEAEGYYESVNLDNMDTFGEQAYYRNEAMRLFRDRGFPKHIQEKYIFTFAVIPKTDSRVLYYLMHLSKNLRALEVMTDSFWKQNNVDSQYHFKIYGLAFETQKYYQENQFILEFNINKDKNELCIDKLHEQLPDIIGDNADGITYGEIVKRTMELNPASLLHYESYFNQLKNNKEIKIFRDGKEFNGTKFKRSDIIKLPRQYQGNLFYNSKLFPK